MRIAAMGVAVLLAVGIATLAAQAPRSSATFSGTWTLDRGRSQIIADAGLFGLGAAGAPTTLHITQAANGTVIVESQMNESHARVYHPGGTSATPAGEGGTVTMTSRMEGRTLVAEGTVEPASGAALPVKEVHTLGANGQTLTITVATATHSSTLVFTRAPTVGSCNSWPTPCKF